MRIVIAGDLSSTNLGDPIICESVKYLVKDITGADEDDIKLFDLVNRKKSRFEESSSEKGFVNETIAIDKTMKRYRKTNLKVLYKWHKHEKRLFDSSFKDMLCKDDDNIIIIAGGALISRSLLYALRLSRIVKIAEKYNARVIFNAVGCEQFDKMDLPHKLMKKALKCKCVSHCSTRDNVDVISRLTKNKDFCKRVPDSGLFAATAYGIQKQESDTVGIGLISFQAYKSVAIDEKEVVGMSTIDLFEFWRSIIDALEKNRQKWKLFTNGGTNDYELACRFVEYYGYSKEERLMPLPQNPKELVEQISTFKAVCVHRLHAAIVSSSLNIKCVPILWSKKVKSFAQMIEAESFWPQKCYANQVVEQMNLEANTEIINALREESKEFLREAIKNET